MFYNQHTPTYLPLKRYNTIQILADYSADYLRLKKGDFWTFMEGRIGDVGY